MKYYPKATGDDIRVALVEDVIITSFPDSNNESGVANFAIALAQVQQLISTNNGESFLVEPYCSHAGFSDKAKGIFAERVLEIVESLKVDPKYRLAIYKDTLLVTWEDTENPRGFGSATFQKPEDKSMKEFLSTFCSMYKGFAYNEGQLQKVVENAIKNL